MEKKIVTKKAWELYDNVEPIDIKEPLEITSNGLIISSDDKKVYKFGVYIYTNEEMPITLEKNDGSNLKKFQNKQMEDVLNDLKKVIASMNNDKSQSYEEKYDSIMYINLDYFKENYEQVSKFLEEIIKNFQGEEITLASSFVNDEILKAIQNKIKMENNKLKKVELGGRFDPYVLTKDDLKKLDKFEEVIVYCIEDNLDLFDLPSNINYRLFDKLIGTYNLRNLKDNKELSITKSLDDKEFSNLKYIGKQVEKIEFLYDDYENIYQVIEKINNPNITFLIKIEQNDKLNFPIKKFEKFSNIFVKIGIDNYPLNYYKEKEAILESYVADIKTSNLSPFEKYLAVYNKVKQYKEYKENQNNLFSSRDLYDILTNEYIVCVGFASLLVDLLAKVGIKANESSTKVIVDDNDKYCKWHDRVLFYLKDPKYNLDGYFFADPTWDNDLENDYYNYAIMTPHEKIGTHVITYSKDDIYGIDDVEELKRRFIHNQLVKMLIKNTKLLDYDFYQQLVEKYSKEEIDLTKYLSDNETKILANDPLIYQYIRSKTQKEISGRAIIDASMEVYKFNNPNLTIQEYSDIRQELIKKNIRRQEKAFPKIEKYNNEQYEVLENKSNKFSR